MACSPSNTRASGCRSSSSMTTRRMTRRKLWARLLLAGWLGKPRACAVGAQAAGDADYLCFCDADTVAQPLLLNTAVKAAQERGAALLSLEPFQELLLPCERLVVPCGFFLLAFTQD